MSKVNCPNCGFEVELNNRNSIQFICTACKNLCRRRKESIDALGVIISEEETTSLIQIGTSGKFELIEFRVVGRLKYSAPGQVWNEWYIEFRNRQMGWLSEANGHYAIANSENIEFGPDREELLSNGVGATVLFDEDSYKIIHIKEATLDLIEGELPLAVNQGEKSLVVEGRSEDGIFGIAYYFSTEKLFIREQTVSSQNLELKNLKAII